MQRMPRACARRCPFMRFRAKKRKASQAKRLGVTTLSKAHQKYPSSRFPDPRVSTTTTRVITIQGFPNVASPSDASIVVLPGLALNLLGQFPGRCQHQAGRAGSLLPGTASTHRTSLQVQKTSVHPHSTSSHLVMTTAKTTSQLEVIRYIAPTMGTMAQCIERHPSGLRLDLLAG